MATRATNGLIGALSWLALVWTPLAWAEGSSETSDGTRSVPLLDAETIATWTIEGLSEASFRVEGDSVTGQPVGKNPKNSFLCSPREYEDFELRFSFRIAPATFNSGVQFRSHVRDDGVVAGPQLEMEVMDPSLESFFKRWIVPILVEFSDHPWRPRFYAAGGVYGEALEHGWIFPGEAGGDPDAFQEQGERLSRVDGWNELRLEAVGPRVRTWLNGELRADYAHEATAKPGRICLQVHGGEFEDPSTHKVEWRNLRITERE